MNIKQQAKVLGIPNGNNATAYHRIIQPLYHLKELKSHPVEFLGERDSQEEQYGWADILYIQCLYNKDAFEFYMQEKLKGKKIVLDLDDDYINIPSDSPEQPSIINKETGETLVLPAPVRIHFIENFIKILADEVVVTTPNLKVLYSKFTQLHLFNKHTGKTEHVKTTPITVIPNCVSPEMERDIPKKANDKIRILWSGSASHLPDLELLKEPLKLIKEKYQDRVEIYLQGPLPFDKIFEDFEFTQLAGVPFENYLNVIQDINPDIVVAPLQDNPFNAGKSNIKYSQMALMEAAFVGSDVGPYKFIDNGVDGFKCKNSKEWVSHISKLIDSEELRKKLTKNSLAFVRSSFYVEKHLDKWGKLLSK